MIHQCKQQAMTAYCTNLYTYCTPGGKIPKVPKQLKTHCKSSVYFKSDYQKMYCAIPQKSTGNVNFQEAKEVCRYE